MGKLIWVPQGQSCLLLFFNPSPQAENHFSQLLKQTVSVLPKVFQCIALLQGFCPSSRPLHSFRIHFFSTAFSALFTASAASQRVSLATSSLTFCPCLLSFCNSTWQLCSSFWCFAALLPELPFARPALICLTSLSIFKILLAVSSLLLLPPCLTGGQLPLQLH